MLQKLTTGSSLSLRLVISPYFAYCKVGCVVGCLVGGADAKMQYDERVQGSTYV